MLKYGILILFGKINWPAVSARGVIDFGIVYRDLQIYRLIHCCSVDFCDCSKWNIGLICNNLKSFTISMLGNYLHMLHGSDFFANSFWRLFFTLLVWLLVPALVRHYGLSDR